MQAPAALDAESSDGASDDCDEQRNGRSGAIACSGLHGFVDGPIGAIAFSGLHGFVAQRLLAAENTLFLAMKQGTVRLAGPKRDA